MRTNIPAFRRMRQMFVGRPDFVEYAGLLVIAFATTVEWCRTSRTCPSGAWWA